MHTPHEWHNIIEILSIALHSSGRAHCMVALRDVRQNVTQSAHICLRSSSRDVSIVQLGVAIRSRFQAIASKGRSEHLEFNWLPGFFPGCIVLHCSLVTSLFFKCSALPIIFYVCSVLFSESKCKKKKENLSIKFFSGQMFSFYIAMGRLIRKFCYSYKSLFSFYLHIILSEIHRVKLCRMWERRKQRKNIWKRNMDGRKFEAFMWTSYDLHKRQCAHGLLLSTVNAVWIMGIF